MSRNDLIAGLDKDVKDLATYRGYVRELRAGGHVENLTLPGARFAVAGLKAAVGDKRAMMARLKACKPNEFEEAFFRFVAAEIVMTNGSLTVNQQPLRERKAPSYITFPRHERR
jgi:hypothetical protein